jgi:hypothetical protein
LAASGEVPEILLSGRRLVTLEDVAKDITLSESVEPVL